VNPADGSVWVGTGEPNTSQDSYAGQRRHRSADNGRTWQLVGNSLPNRLVYQITFDGAGHVYAATSYGLLRRSALDLTSAWKTVLKPDPNPTNSPYRTSFVTDVKVQPGTDGNTVIAAVVWRGGTNVSGNLPDAPANASVIWRGKLVVSTDVGIFATSFSGPGNWVRVGTGQPVAPSVDLSVSPDRGYLLVATHG